MQEWMLSLIDGYGYFGILLLIFAENVFPPIPSEVVLLFGGAMTVGTALKAPLVAFFATLGSLFGAAVLYFLGCILEAERLKKLFSGRFGKVLRLKPEYVDKAEKWFLKYEGKAVLICRCIPLVRSIISVPAGFAKMQLPKFFTLTALGSAVWNTVLVYIGAALGAAWETALPYFKRYTVTVGVVCVALLLILAVFCFIFHKNTRKIH